MEPEIDPAPSHSNTKRARQACTNCRRKKARCSGERPRCNSCARLSQTCLYDDRWLSRRSNRRETPDNKTSVSSEFAFLLAKIEGLETNLRLLTDKLHAFVEGPPATDDAPSTQASISSVPRSSQSRSPGTELVRDENNLLLSNISPSALQSLLDTYFRFCHNQPYSFFHEKSFRDRMTKGLVPQHLALAFIATAVRFMSDNTLSGARESRISTYAAAAWKTLVTSWMAMDEKPSLDIVQAITLLSIINFTAGKLHPAWMKIGLSVRLAQDLRLMLEPSNSETQVVQEERRRTFWSIYLLDKVVSVGRARPPAIGDEDCQVGLPFDVIQNQQSECLSPTTLQQLKTQGGVSHEDFGAFALSMVTASVFSDCTRYMIRNLVTHEEPPWNLGSPFAAINSNLLDLESRFDITTSFSHSLQSDCMSEGLLDQRRAGHVLLSRMLFRMCHCLLHHPLLLRMRLESCTARAPYSFRNQMSQKAFSEAQAVTELIQEAESAGCNTMASFYGCCMTIAGGVQALYTAHDDQSMCRKASDSLTVTLAYLQRLSTYWTNATSMVSNLKAFAIDAHSHKDLLDLGNPLQVTQVKLEQFWRLVDYSAMSLEHSEVADSTKSPTWFDFAWDPNSLLSSEQLPNLQLWDSFANINAGSLLDGQSALRSPSAPFAASNL